ncbi:MAG: protein of unknown function, containing repeat [Nitrospira sp.]|nr:protein of unknown function, containing repeat [Nitrospira sp.]
MFRSDVRKGSIGSAAEYTGIHKGILPKERHSSQLVGVGWIAGSVVVAFGCPAVYSEGQPPRRPFGVAHFQAPLRILMRRAASFPRSLLMSLPLFCLIFFHSTFESQAAPSSDTARRSYERGVELFREGDADGAIEALKKAIVQNPRLPEAYHVLGLVYFQSKRNPDDAIQSYKQSLKLSPPSAEILNDLADVYLAQGRGSDAEAVLRQILDIAPGNEEAHLDLARLYEERRDRPNAVKMYQSLLRVRPDHAKALYQLANLYDSQGDLKMAREQLSRLTHANPRHADAWYLLGRLAERTNDLHAAAAAFKEAIAVRPDLVDAHYNLAFVYRSQGLLAEAEHEFLEVIRYRPEYAEAHLNLGMVYTSLNRLDEAEKEHERAVALKPNSAEAHYNLGVFYELHRKDMVRALAQYRRYRDLGGRDERVERIIGIGHP